MRVNEVLNESGYAVAKAARDQLQAEVDAASAAVRAFDTGSGPMGLTPDAVKADPAYQAARAAYAAAFARLRDFNGRFNKAFAKEIRADRRR